MQVEASHIVALLQELGEQDATCRKFATYAKKGEPILSVCQAAIRALVTDKEALKKLIIEMATEPSR